MSASRMPVMIPQGAQQSTFTAEMNWYRITLKDGAELDIQARRVGWTPSGAIAFHTLEDGGAELVEFLAAPGEWLTLKRLSEKKCDLHVFKAK
jgi:hypothetical protein